MKTKVGILILSWLSFVLIGFNSSVVASPSVAFLSSAIGDVVVNQEGKDKAASPMALYPGNLLKTGDDGSATVHYHDGTLIEIGSNTELEFDYAQDDENQVILQSGSMSSQVVLGSLFKAKTPQGEVKVNADEDVTELQLQSSSGRDIVSVSQGDVLVSTPVGVVMAVKTGAGAVLKKSEPPLLQEKGDFIRVESRKPLYEAFLNVKEKPVANTPFEIGVIVKTLERSKKVSRSVSLSSETLLFSQNQSDWVPQINLISEASLVYAKGGSGDHSVLVQGDSLSGVSSQLTIRREVKKKLVVFTLQDDKGQMRKIRVNLAKTI